MPYFNPTILTLTSSERLGIRASGDSDQMQSFPSTIRLKNSSEFRQTLDHGVKVVCPEMVLVAAPCQNKTITEEAPRIGLIASKKVGNSVVRNRVKRNLRESFRLIHEDLCGQDEFKGIDLVVIARAKAASIHQPQMQTAMKQSLRRLAKKLG